MSRYIYSDAKQTVRDGVPPSFKYLRGSSPCYPVVAHVAQRSARLVPYGGLVRNGQLNPTPTYGAPSVEAYCASWNDLGACGGLGHVGVECTSQREYTLTRSPFFHKNGSAFFWRAYIKVNYFITVMRILLPLDLTESPEFVSSAEAFAKSTGGEIFVLHVMPALSDQPGMGFYDGLLGTYGASAYALFDPAVRVEMEQAEQLALDEFVAKHFSMPVQRSMQQGDPSTAILESAKALEVDLIVVGRRKHSLLEKLLLGSVARLVMRDSEIPVLVIPVVER